MDYRLLGNTGLKISNLSFGASSLGGVFHSVTRENCLKTVHTALDLGINFIDVSPFYGLTKAETELGIALKGISRDNYYLATKVGRYGMDIFDFSAKRVTASVDESLNRLQCGYIDLIQCHDMEFVKLDQIINETIPALNALRQAGKVRFVGITGLPLKIVSTVLDQTRVDTILSYCHYSLNDTALETMIPYLEEKGVGIINASPLSMGLLTERGVPDWHPATEDIIQACQKALQFCKEKGADLPKLAVQFSARNPKITTTLVGTANPDNIKQNIQWVESPIDEELLHDVLKILEPVHNKTWQSGLPENN